LIHININLLGVERKESLQRKGLSIDKGWLISVSSVLGAAIILLSLNMLLGNWIANAEATKLDNQAKIKKLDAQLKEIEELEGKKKSLLMEEKILRYVTGETYRWSYLLQEIRTLMPIDVQINGLKFDAKGAVSLSGEATDHRSVALFLANLQSSKLIFDVRLRSSIKESNDAATVFVINCKIGAN